MAGYNRQSVYLPDRDGLEKCAAAAGEKKFRASQLENWLYVRFARSFDEMSNLPGSFRRFLCENFLSPCETLSLLETAADRSGTVKYLWRLCDGELIETVGIPSGERMTVCVSSQAGCGFGCAFCASCKNGFSRNLDCAEIVAQAALVSAQAGGKPDNIVFMGIGEPFANYDNVLAAARRFNGCFGIGARKITVSTCGVVPGILRYACEPEQFELAVSLHAPDDEMRSRLMPVNRRWPIRELMAACREYTARTNRIVTFEYILVDGLNCSRRHASELLALLKDLKCRVNLIPLNPVNGFSWRAPSREICRAFGEFLTSHGLNTTLRHSRGGNVNASCGQLRRARASSLCAGETAGNCLENTAQCAGKEEK